jgi:ketosteroid isomerase-like protein
LARATRTRATFALGSAMRGQLRKVLGEAILWTPKQMPKHDSETRFNDRYEGGPMQTATASTSDRDALVDLNREYIRSVQTSDVRRFEQILGEDFLCSNPDGSLVDRKGFLEQTARPVQISNLEAHDVNVRLLGDVAIIHARTTYTGSDGQPRSGRYTDVWARRDGRWLAISAHVTRA